MTNPIDPITVGVALQVEAGIQDQSVCLPVCSR